MARTPWNRIVVVGCAVFTCLALVAGSIAPVTNSPPEVSRQDGPEPAAQGAQARSHAHKPTHADKRRDPQIHTRPNELHLTAAHAKVFDVRTLRSKPVKRERPEHHPPGVQEEDERAAPGGSAPDETEAENELPAVIDPASMAGTTENSAPAPASTSFDGLDFNTWGTGHPPDTNGDVGPQYYIETINVAIGIYDKSTGAQVAAFTFDSFMSQGNFGNLCDTDNFGDPVVVYDSFEDRWVISDFAFKLDGSDNVVNPPGSFQCFAVSKTGDPVTGGWNYYWINTAAGLGDYPKFGVWPDGIYWSVNMFDYAAAGSFQNVRVYAMNKFQMYANEPTVQVASFDAPSTEFTMLPANARLQTGTPPSGSPNYFATVWNYLNVISVWKFHVDWNAISTSTFSGPFDSLTATSWTQLNAGEDLVPSQGGNTLDTLYPRLMVQNQYTRVGGVESLWDSHTVGNSTTVAGVRYYQVKVTGGAVEANTTQAATWGPNTTLDRFMPSVAADRAGNMAIGYSTSSSTTKPAIKYAGRLAADPVNTISQTEQLMFQGSGTQVGNCGGDPCHRWGDYSAMTLDPDGCTFWYTNEYYATDGLDHHTRIGSFKYPSCTSVGSGGTLSGTVTSGGPISGATVSLGSRTTTTDGSGNYSFIGLPAGTYPTLTAAAAGYGSGSVSSIVVADGGTATQNFSLTVAAQSGSFVDTTQPQFVAGVPEKTDLATSAGNVILLNAPFQDQHADANGNNGYGFTSSTLRGQTFTPSATGTLTRADAYIFCSGCSGTDPSITLEVRTTNSGNPVMTAAGLLASATVPGTSSPSGGLLSFTYNPPPMLTGGVQYGLVIRLAANRTAGTQAWLATTGDTYAGGRRKVCTTTSCANASGQNANSDQVFKTFMKTGYSSPGTFVSSAKDANPASGSVPTWGNLSWNATTPAGTTVTFQAAASDSAAGVFAFVGPDGTSATTFSNGASLSQFNGQRYLRYRARLTTTSGSTTPTLADVTIAFSDVVPAATTSLGASSATGTYGGTVNLSATLTSGAGVSGKSISFSLNGTAVGSATTNGSGVATLNGASLTGINAGSYPNGVNASFLGDASYGPSTDSAALTVDKGPATMTFDAATLNQTYDGTPKAVTVTTSPASLTGVAITYDGSSIAPTAVGSYTVDATLDNINYEADAISDTLVITDTSKQDQTIDFGTLADRTYGTANFTVSATASSGLTVSFAAAGDCSMASATSVHVDAVGTCTITASQAGDATYNPAPDIEQQLDVAPAASSVGAISVGTTNGNPTPQFGDTVTLSATVAPAATVTGDGVFSGTLVFRINGNPVGGVSAAVSNSAPTGQISLQLGSTIVAAGAGSYAVTATFAPDVGSNYAGSNSAAQSLSVSREGQSSIGRDGSTSLVYGGANYVAAGVAPVLLATLGQSLAPEATDTQYIDFSTLNINVIFRVYKAKCGTTCPTTPVYTSAQTKLDNSATYATTHTATAQLNGPSGLATGSYLLTVSLVSNGYIVANVAYSTLEVAPSTAPSIAGGGWLPADSTSNAQNAHGDFTFTAKKVSGTLSGSFVYVYRMRINVTTSTVTSLVACTTLSASCRDVAIIVRSGAAKSLNTGASNTYPRTGFAVWTARAQFVDAADGTTHYTALEFTGGKVRIDVTDSASTGTTDRFGLTVYRSGAVFHQAFIPTSGALTQSGTGSPTNKALIGAGNATVRHP
jgi:MBG domain/Carboxypeptidase regulatory-like domain